MCCPTRGTPIPVTQPKATQTPVAGHKQAAGLMVDSRHTALGKSLSGRGTHREE